MSALKQLADRKVEANRIKYPSVPEYAIPRPKFSDKNSNELTKAVIEHINLSGNGFAWRVNNTGVYDEKLGRYRTSNSIKGIADISAIIRTTTGNVLPAQLEVKFGKDFLSDGQIKFKEKIEAVGGLYFAVRNYSDFVYWFDQVQKERSVLL
jgi:hypothetical protein